MANVLIVIYLLIVLAMIAVILLQRSEGGALGIGGGNNGFAAARTSANLLTRTTAILAALFMATAIALSVVNDMDRGSQGILESAAESEEGTGASSVLDALNSLQGEDSSLAIPEIDADAPNLALPNTDMPAAGESTGN